MNVINNKYEIVQKVGQGQFGAVCKVKHLKTGQYYAAKMEKPNPLCNTIKHEATVLHYLDTQKCKHVPYLYHYGFSSPYNTIVISYYSQGSLQTWKPVIQFEEVLDWWNTSLTILEHVHKAGIVHRDLKPAHFMRDDNHKWHLIDFGLSSTFLDDSQEHILETPKDNIIGSPNYVSWFVHQGKDVVRRDDVLSLVYIFWEMLYGSYLESPETIENTSSTEVIDPYNIWLRDQKDFERLYLLLKNKNDVMVDFLVSILSHIECLDFDEKPNYILFMVDIDSAEGKSL